MILTDQGQQDFEAERLLLTSILRRFNRTLEDLRPEDCLLRRAYQGYPKKTQDPQASVSRKMARNEAVAPIPTAVGCSRT